MLHLSSRELLPTSHPGFQTLNWSDIETHWPFWQRQIPLQLHARRRETWICVMNNFISGIRCLSTNTVKICCWFLTPLLKNNATRAFDKPRKAATVDFRSGRRWSGLCINRGLQSRILWAQYHQSNQEPLTNEIFTSNYHQRRFYPKSTIFTMRVLQAVAVLASLPILAAAWEGKLISSCFQIQQ